MGNFSQDYRQTVAFYYGLGNGDSVTIGNATGLMVVDASDVKYFGESNGSDLFACGTEEQIQLRGDSVDGLSWEYKYQTNYDESSGDKNGCQTSQSLRRGSIEILLRDESSNIVIGTQYIMPDMANTSLFSTTPVKLIENFESIDPKAILTEISTFPSSINDIEEGRSKLSGNETLEYSWRENYESGSFKTQYTLTVYATNNTNSDQLIINEYDDGNTTPTSTTEIQGAEAIQRLAEHLNSQSDSATAIFYTKQSIEGEAIDGYIEGAEIYFDQNFNFIRDDEELFTTTGSDGSFELNVLDTNLYQCLINRPIVAEVPVGAIDSTLGTVTEAYQMILPSINDAGTETVVISPFTTLLSEAILSAKENNDDFTEDLTIDEGCGSKGDQLASRISSKIDELENYIETTFDIEITNLYSDFIEGELEGKISEQAAQNIATIFPYIKEINDEISDFLTEKYNKNIRPMLL